MGKKKKNNLRKIEVAVEKYIKKEYPGAIIKKEFGRKGYAVRPDYAVFTKDKLIFIEIKGNRDTLARLSRQIFHYQRVADSVIVITDSKYNLDMERYGVGTAIYKKKKLKNIIKPKVSTEKVTDILYMLYSSELDQMLRFINIKFNTLVEKQNAIKAIYSQFEIRKYAYEILYNRMFYKSKEGLLTSEILSIDNKREAFNFFQLGLMI